MADIPVEQPISDGIDEQDEQDQSSACLVGHLHRNAFGRQDIKMDGHGPDRREQRGGHQQGGARGQNKCGGLPDAPSDAQDDAGKDPGKGTGQDRVDHRLPFRPPERVAHLALLFRDRLDRLFRRRNDCGQDHRS